MKGPPGRENAIRDVRELRGHIERFAARHAAERIRRGADPKPLRDVFTKFEQGVRGGDLDKAAQVDIAFHRALVQLANVESLVDAWELVQRREAGFRRQALQVSRPELDLLLDMHRSLLDTICAGDAAGAEQAVRIHMELVWYRLSEAPDGLTIRHDRMAAAHAYLTLHMNETVQLSFLARRVCRTSTSHLARLFRKAHGMSFTAYFRQLRMSRATDLLISTNHSIRSVALAVGYKDASRFIEHFRRHSNLTPRAYRNRYFSVPPL